MLSWLYLGYIGLSELLKLFFTFFLYLLEYGFLGNLKLYMWFIHIFPLDGVPLRSRVDNIKTPASVTGIITLSHQTIITINYTPCSIPGLFRMDDHWRAVNAFIQVSELGRIIGLWNRNNNDSLPTLPSSQYSTYKGSRKVIPTWMLEAYQFFPTSVVDVASLLAWG